MDRKVTGFVSLVLAGAVFFASAPAFAAGPAAASGARETTVELTSLVSSTLSQAEIDGLLWMREEEKLAHDVYVTLYEEWGISTFRNIAKAEQTHLEAVSRLLDRYGIADPADKLGVGEFSDGTLQDLYDTLVARGLQSSAEALKVGAAIEEIDIIDLEEEMAQTGASDILRTYSNLLRGSENHLRAFIGALERQTGETYAPQYLDAEDYAEIVVPSVIAPATRGRRGR